MLELQVRGFLTDCDAVVLEHQVRRYLTDCDPGVLVVVVGVDPTPPTCCQQSPAPESCGSQQSLPPGGKERLHFVGIRPEVQARKVAD